MAIEPPSRSRADHPDHGQERRTSPAQCEVVSQILGPGRARRCKTLKARADHPCRRASTRWFNMRCLPHPQLWSLESPKLYQLQTTILRDGQPVDFTTTTLASGPFAIDADKGFFLNGRHVEIQGTASHQDFAGRGDCRARQPAGLAGQPVEEDGVQCLADGA